MTPDVIAGLDRIESALQVLLERQAVKDREEVRRYQA
jgi:hypothetical protein